MVFQGEQHHSMEAFNGGIRQHSIASSDHGQSPGN
jgi:hypothetical protein